MKNVFASFLILVLLGIGIACWESPVNAQTAGTVGIATTAVQLLSASTSTGRTVVPAKNMIGAATHFFEYCYSGSGVLKLMAEGSPDGLSAHWTPISTQYGNPPTQINGNSCAFIVASGPFQYLAVNVIAVTLGNVSVWYLGSAAPINSFPPAALSVGGGSLPWGDQTLVVTLAQSTGNTAEINGAQGQSIYLTGGSISFNAATTAGTISVLQGAGPSCGTSTATVAILQITANTPQTIPWSVTAKLTPGNNLCLGTGAITASASFNLSFAQY